MTTNSHRFAAGLSLVCMSTAAIVGADAPAQPAESAFFTPAKDMAEARKIYEDKVSQSAALAAGEVKKWPADYRRRTRETRGPSAEIRGNHHRCPWQARGAYVVPKDTLSIQPRMSPHLTPRKL